MFPVVLVSSNDNPLTCPIMRISATKTSTEKIKGSRLAFTMLHPTDGSNLCLLVCASAIHSALGTVLEAFRPTPPPRLMSL